MNFQKSQTWLVAAGALAVLLLAAGWFLLVAPARSSADELTAKADEAQAQNVSTQAKIEQLKALSKDLPAQEQRIAEVRTHIPLSPAQPTLIRSLSDIAKNSGVSLDTVTPGPPALEDAVPGAPASASQVTNIPMQVQITGEFANVRLFLNGLETLQRSFLVTGVNTTRGQADDGSTTLTTSITGQVFMSAPAHAPAAAVVPPAAPADAAPAS